MTGEKFRAGDRVMYIGEMNKEYKGKVYTIKGTIFGPNQYEVLEDNDFAPMDYNLILCFKDSICSDCESKCGSDGVKECPFYRKRMILKEVKT